MQPMLYAELTPWYRLLDPPADHLAEADSYTAALARAVPNAETLLDLGAGAGHNALHMKRRFRATLADLSEDMLALSREINPECEHRQGDMRTLRLNRTFDVVLVHDAIAYMTTEADLLAAITTAFVHTRPGGATLFAPDIFRETFHENSELFEEDDGDRSLRCLAWTWDPDPLDDTCRVEYAFLLRDGTEMRAVHDRHIEGLFARETWTRLLQSVGYEVEMVPRPLDDGAFDEVFLARRP